MLCIAVYLTTTTKPLDFSKLHATLHELLCDGKIVTIDDVIATLHRIRLVAADLHSYHLRNTVTLHVAHGRSAQIMEVEFGISRTVDQQPGKYSTNK
jgi:hypothetical protein